MKTRILLLTTVLLSVQGLAQVNVDSLLLVWNDGTRPDTVRLEAMNRVAKEGFLFTDPDSAFVLASLAYELAKRKVVPIQQVKALNVMGYAHYIIGEYDKGLDFYGEGAELAEAAKLKKELGTIYNNRALIHMARSENSLALEFFSKSLRLQEQIGNRFGMAVLLNNIGIIYMDQGDHARAVEHYGQSLKIQEELGDTRVMANTLNNLGNIYQDQKDFERAKDYYEKSLDLAEKAEDNLAIANAQNNLGLVFRNMNKFDKALEYHLKARAIYEEQGDRQKVAIILDNIGNIYRDRNDLHRAQELYEESLKISEKVGDVRGASATLGNLAHLNREMGRPDKAHEYDVRSLAYAQEAGEPRGIRDAADQLYEYYKIIGNTTKALEMHELYTAMRDSIMSEENQRETIRTEFSREAEQRESQIALLNLENEKKQAETLAERNKRMFTLGISGSLIVLLLGGGFFLQRSRKQKHQVEISRAELQKNLVENDFLRSQLDPHFVKNALFNIDGLLGKDRVEDAQRYTDRFHRLMELTLKNARRGLVGLDEELEMMEHYLALEAERLENRLEWTVKVADDVNPEEIELPPMILQPLVENALKHGADMKSGTGRVSLEVSVENDRVLCTVQDNGSGIDLEQMARSTSDGLRITRQRLEIFSKLNLADARLEMTNTGSGTRAVVSFANHS